MNGKEFYEAYSPLGIFNKEHSGDPDDCARCFHCLSQYKTTIGLPITMSYMVVCQDCGNKRCPKSTHHDNECTGSNELGQAGSRYA